jgi:hypothetical protein
MTRRLQLLDSESRSSGRSVSAMISRIRDGLLRDNKVIPAVLGVLALLIFAWLVAGALIGGPGDEEEQRASNQASLAQGEDSDSGDAETPAPGVENRDSDASYGGFEEGPKDPFRQLIPKAGEEDGGGQNDRDGSDDRAGNGGGQDSRGDNGGRSTNGRDGDTGSDDDGGGDEDFIEQRTPGGSGSWSVPGRAGGQGGASQDGAGQTGEGQGSPGQGSAGQAGGLFNSGGDLPAP